MNDYNFKSYCFFNDFSVNEFSLSSFVPRKREKSKYFYIALEWLWNACSDFEIGHIVPLHFCYFATDTIIFMWLQEGHS